MNSKLTIIALDNKEFEQLPYKYVKEALGIADTNKNTAYIRMTPDYEENKDTIHHEVEELYNGNADHMGEDGIYYKKNWYSSITRPFGTGEGGSPVGIANNPITRTIGQVGLGMIPGVGPLLSAGLGAASGYSTSEGNLLQTLLGGAGGYGIGGIGAGLGNWLTPGGTSFAKDFGTGMSNYFNTPGLGGLFGAGGKVGNLLGLGGQGGLLGNLLGGGMGGGQGQGMGSLGSLFGGGGEGDNLPLQLALLGLAGGGAMSMLGTDEARTKAEEGISQAGSRIGEASRLSPEEQQAYQGSFGLGNTLQQQMLAQAQNPEAFYTSTLTPQLQLAEDYINRQAQGRGLLRSGLPIEQMGRAGVELAIKEANARLQSRQNLLQQSQQFFTGQQQLGQSSLARQLQGAGEQAQYTAYPYQARLGDVYGRRAAGYALPGQALGALGLALSGGARTNIGMGGGGQQPQQTGGFNLSNLLGYGQNIQPYTNPIRTQTYSDLFNIGQNYFPDYNY